MDRLAYIKYLILAAFTFLVVSASAVVFNYLADPFWVFDHSFRLSHVFYLRDERQSKTNFLRYGKQSYDGVLLGSSRTVLLDTGELSGTIFNYSFSSANPDEYLAFLSYFVQQKGRPSKVIIGVDFFGTRMREQNTYPTPEAYFNSNKSPTYRIKAVFGLDALLTGLANVFWYSSGRFSTTRLYTRDGIARLPRPSRRLNVSVEDMQKDLEWYAKYRFGDDVYEYNENLLPIFRELRDQYDDADFLIFTTPISFPLYRTLLAEGRFDDYARWIHELVHVFGQVQDFIGANSFTTNLDNYYDTHHIWSDRVSILARRLGREAVPGYEDFGTIVTSKTVDTYLDKRRRESLLLLAN